MNRRTASPRSRLSHRRASSRFLAGFSPAIGVLPNSRVYAWLLATPRLKKTSCWPSPTSGSVRTRMESGAPRSSFFGFPFTGWNRYLYTWPGFAVKSSQTKLWTGWSNVLTRVPSSGWGITDSKTLNPGT